MDERLEGIIRKNEAKRKFGAKLEQQDIDYLIQQAEKVPELEEENKKLKAISQAKSEEINGLLEHFDTSWEEIFDE